MVYPNRHGIERGIRLVGLGGLKPEVLRALFNGLPNYSDFGIELDEETLGAAVHAGISFGEDRGRECTARWRGHAPVFLIEKAPVVTSFQRVDTPTARRRLTEVQTSGTNTSEPS